MHAMGVDERPTDRARETRRIDVTDVETAQVTEYAATCENGTVRLERRGGWTYLIEER